MLQVSVAGKPDLSPSSAGNFNFDRIGSEYPDGFPVFALRLLPAVAGALLLPAAYCLLRQLGVSRAAAGLAGILLLLGR